MGEDGAGSDYLLLASARSFSNIREGNREVEKGSCKMLVKSPLLTVGFVAVLVVVGYFA
jgi:hypothetical protein